MHFVIHNCQVKLNQTWKTVKFTFAYVKWNHLLMLNEYKKLFKVWAISQTEHNPESFVPVKRMLCKAATTNVNLKFHGISQTAVASVSVHCPII